MVKYKVEKNNKYKGRFTLINDRVKAKVLGKKFRIRFFSVLLALEYSFASFWGISLGIPRKKDMDYLYANSYYNMDELNSNLLTFEDEYRQLKNNYNSMTDEEKSAYVVSIFENIIDNSDEFTEEEKKSLKTEKLFLEEYGKYYYFYNIFDMVSRLRRVKVNRRANLRKDVGGNYEKRKNLINIDKDYVEDTSIIGHEVEHAITTHEILNYYSHLYIMESMDSSTDLKYYDSFSYDVSMRNHMLFLSKIIGRDNLIKVYLNNDFDLLKNLLGNDYLELMQLFSKQMLLIKKDRKIYKYCDEIADKLKEIYEKKNNCLIEDDPFMNIIYEASKYDSNFHVYSTLFSDDINYYEVVAAECFDEVIDIDLNYSFDERPYLKTRSLNNIKKYYNKKQIGDESISVRKVNYFFTDEIVKKIINSSNPKVYLRIYLEEIGVSNSNYWVYNILNNKNPVVCCSKIYDYDTLSYYNDLRIILKNKYDYLKSEDRLYELYDDFDVFFSDGKNVDKNKFCDFMMNVLNYGDNLDYEEIINKSSRETGSNSRRK